jgi:hypothetical protein
LLRLFRFLRLASWRPSRPRQHRKKEGGESCITLLVDPRPTPTLHLPIHVPPTEIGSQLAGIVTRHGSSGMARGTRLREKDPEARTVPELAKGNDVPGRSRSVQRIRLRSVKHCWLKRTF